MLLLLLLSIGITIHWLDLLQQDLSAAKCCQEYTFKVLKVFVFVSPLLNCFYFFLVRFGSISSTPSRPKKTQKLQTIYLKKLHIPFNVIYEKNWSTLNPWLGRIIPFFLLPDFLADFLISYYNFLYFSVFTWNLYLWHFPTSYFRL